ncbi:phospholipase D [Rhodotorula toruloides]|uniref:phospholipase D n=1 Tax=Rhodotorula toruloides TaxID=5286 RepID=A0A511K8B1_RHOTO|nr:phospholipase D [Rhodotorula toruloides]
MSKLVHKLADKVDKLVRTVYFLLSLTSQFTAPSAGRAGRPPQRIRRLFVPFLPLLPSVWLIRRSPDGTDAVNPNHRHDEEHEKAEDEMRRRICESHRFGSFSGNGHDYFYALSEILDQAQETIWILDWWLTPELFLRRPPSQHEDFRLDRLLLRKAQQGVKIFIVVYKEATQTMTMSSHHSKHFLEDLHENIAVMRHPDHIGGEVTLYWSHHEKVVVVDNCIACIGGLDICFGRWDTSSHPLSDVHPTDFSRTLFAGRDYNNARIQDFQAVDYWVSNQQSRLEAPRMPWHDVHSMLTGPAVLDVAQHFVERHPHLQKFAEIGQHFHIHLRSPGPEGWSEPIGPRSGAGTTRVQVLRSSADWSHGIETESSIQTAYVELIREARHFVFISNQFFVSKASEDDKAPVSNRVAQAIVERVLSAARSEQKLKVVILIPAIPGFAGDLYGNSGTLAILAHPTSRLGLGDYIEVYHLRSFDRINNDPERIKRMEQKSGVSFQQAQAALARVYLGPDALEKNKIVKFAVPQEGGETAALDVKAAAKKPNLFVEIPLPQGYDDAWDIIHRFERADDVREQISDSLAHHANHSGGNVETELWCGDEASERNAFVTEETYIHSKLMIVDDLRVLMGSANINDRSLLGDRDSEIACVYEDYEDMIESRMNGKPFMASRFAASLRRQLYKDHLGLSTPQICPPVAQEPVTAAMRPVGVPQEDSTASREDELVMASQADGSDPATIFNEIFHAVPSPDVETWAQYKAFVPQHPIKPGHVAGLDTPVSEIKAKLSQVRGRIVPMRLNFLRDAKMFETDASVNPITMAIYL